MWMRLGVTHHANHSPLRLNVSWAMKTLPLASSSHPDDTGLLRLAFLVGGIDWLMLHATSCRCRWCLPADHAAVAAPSIAAPFQRACAFCLIIYLPSPVLLIAACVPPLSSVFSLISA